MSALDQCPSSKKEGKSAVKARPASERSLATGREYWRSAEDLADSPEFRAWLEREFPDGASELKDDESRREFLKVMGASLALAGVLAVPGCRRPDHKILAYNREPENIVPGNPLYFATAMPIPGGGAQGLLAKTFTGRPVKLEGNPLHPVNRGRTDIFAQAAILDLYDPDRLKEVNGPRADDTWASFESWAKGKFASFDATGGEGLAFLVEKISSPSRDAMRRKVLSRWKNAKWLAYEPIDRRNTIEGSRLAFGAPMRERLDLSKARVILSLDRDFLSEFGAVAENRSFAAGRRVHGKTAADATMNRLYAIETMMTLTGGAADHRVRLGPGAIADVGTALLLKTIGALGAGRPEWADRLNVDEAISTWVDACAEDLAANKGGAIVVVGESQPGALHALAHHVNALLGAVGPIVTYAPLTEDEAADSLESITTLAKAIDAGRVDTLVTIGCNPCFDAPADLDFGAKHAKVGTTISLSVGPTETSAASKWSIHRAHFLESWGDVIASDGAASVIQPMIAPIFGARSDLELLATLVNDETTDGYEIVRRTWRDRLGATLDAGAFEKAWRRTLHDGVSPGAPAKPAAPRLNAAGLPSWLGAIPRNGAPEGALLQAVFLADPRLHDGRFANNAWMQETPHQITKVTWDNPALLSPATAKRLGIKSGDPVTVSRGGRKVDALAFIQPGLADDVVALTLGSGRTVCGRIGERMGYDTYAVRTSDAMTIGAGFVVNPKGGRVADIAYAGLLANTQDHHSMEGRPIIREVDLAAWQKWGDRVFEQKDAYGAERRLNFGAALGDEAETPANRDVYLPRQSHPFETGDAHSPHQGRAAQVYPTGLQQWGMSIDMTTCTGCGACITACQAENNVPVVGKAEVQKGREMHWLRVDRYYSGSEDAPDMVVQPVACVHCENAPCETVCPVNATIHGPEGTNDMAYNRCIGTRYCSNNCPYKVRRFNWFDYATKQLHGGFGQLAEGLSKDYMPRSEHFVPPRLREKVSELSWMKNNPNVTVRIRGVMEKCSYCIQRVNRARVETKLTDLKRIPDGFFETACQQVCPTESIVFGDISDPGSKATALREHGRSYMLLASLNTRPRTTHMVRLRNPNPKIRKPEEDPALILEAVKHSEGHHEESHPPGAPGHETPPAGAGHSMGRDAQGNRVVRLQVLGGRGAGRREAITQVIAGALS